VSIVSSLPAVLVMAAEVVKTSDGRTLLLKDDGTYEIMGPKGSSVAKTYARIPIVDIALDGERLHRKDVETQGRMAAGTLGSELTSLSLYQQPSMVGVRLELGLERLTREQKRRILTVCTPTCDAVIRGELRRQNLVIPQVTIIVDDFDIKK
jgi:hypothetical protein